MQFLHCPMLFSLAMIEKIERSGERNVEKVFFMKISNIVFLIDPQLQSPPSRKFFAMHFLHSPQLSSLAMGCIHCWGGRRPARHDRNGQGGLLVVERRLEQGQWCLWLNFPAGRPGHWAGLASSSG